MGQACCKSQDDIPAPLMMPRSLIDERNVKKENNNPFSCDGLLYATFTSSQLMFFYHVQKANLSLAATSSMPKSARFYNGSSGPA